MVAPRGFRRRGKERASEKEEDDGRDGKKGDNDGNTLLESLLESFWKFIRPIRLRTDYYVFLTRLNLNIESYPLIRSAIREFSTSACTASLPEI